MHHVYLELFLAFQAGKYHCFETLYERALPKVYRYLLFKTNGNKTLAQDLCSETFLAGFEGLGSFQADENCNFWAWILRIAHHKFVDHIRARQEEQLSLNEELIVTGEDQLLQSLDLSMQAWVFLDFLETLGEEKKDIVGDRRQFKLTIKNHTAIVASFTDKKYDITVKKEFNNNITFLSSQKLPLLPLCWYFPF